MSCLIYIHIFCHMLRRPRASGRSRKESQVCWKRSTTCFSDCHVDLLEMLLVTLDDGEYIYKKKLTRHSDPNTSIILIIWLTILYIKEIFGSKLPSLIVSANYITLLLQALRTRTSRRTNTIHNCVSVESCNKANFLIANAPVHSTTQTL